MKRDKTVRTFKDIKNVLNKVPDEILEVLGLGTGEGSEETVGVIAWADNYEEIFDKINKKYPKLNEVFKLIESVKEAQEKLDEQEDEEFAEIMGDGIDSKTKIELKNKKDDLSEMVKEKLRKDKGRWK